MAHIPINRSHICFSMRLSNGAYVGKTEPEKEDILFGEEEGDASFIQNQTVCTIESIRVHNDIMYVYPMADCLDGDLNQVKDQLQWALERWEFHRNFGYYPR